MLLWLLVLSCVLGVAAWWWARRRSTPRPPLAKVPSGAKRHPYRAVAITCGQSACGAAADLEGQRFLAGEAALLPLANCDAVLCRCRYAHFEDRRDDDRRRPNALQGGWLGAQGKTDRRDEADRRRSMAFT